MKLKMLAIGLSVAVTMLTSRGSATSFREPECNPGVVPGYNYWCMASAGEACSEHGSQFTCEYMMAALGCTGTIYNSYCSNEDCVNCYWSPLE